MIRYDIFPNQLRELVEQHAPGWIERARDRTNSFRTQGRYRERSSIWSEVKPVFMAVQGEAKCCFCERKFEAGDLGRYELDLEHFRPKGNVKRWPCPPELIDRGVSLTNPPVADTGYYLLPYHLLNYAVACKPCNSGLKKDHFPIAGPYDLDGDDPGQMTAERPWLLYPIGRLDVDPEDVITFYGLLPQSTSADRLLRLRGLVTIAFFRLDDVLTRKELMKERALIVFILHSLLVKAEDDGDEESAVLVKELLSPTSKHTSCARSFERLFRFDRAQAAEVADRVEKYLVSGSL